MKNNLVFKLQQAQNKGIDMGVAAMTAVATVAFYNYLQEHDLPKDDVHVFDSEMGRLFHEYVKKGDQMDLERIAYYYEEVIHDRMD